MFPFLKKSPWCTVLRLLLSLQPLLPPQVYPTQQQRQPIRFASLFSFLSLIRQLWIGALSSNQDWLHHRSTALLSLLKASSAHRASIELDSIAPLFPYDWLHLFYILHKLFCSDVSHCCALLLDSVLNCYLWHRNVLWGQKQICFLMLFMHMFMHEILSSWPDYCIAFNMLHLYGSI